MCAACPEANPATPEGPPCLVRPGCVPPPGPHRVPRTGTRCRDAWLVPQAAPSRNSKPCGSCRKNDHTPCSRIQPAAARVRVTGERPPRSHTHRGPPGRDPPPFESRSIKILHTRIASAMERVRTMCPEADCLCPAASGREPSVRRAHRQNSMKGVQVHIPWFPPPPLSRLANVRAQKRLPTCRPANQPAARAADPSAASDGAGRNSVIRCWMKSLRRLAPCRREAKFRLGAAGRRGEPNIGVAS